MSDLSPFVSAEWLEKNLDQANLIVIDCRWYLDGPDPREVFAEGHIDGAVWADLDTDMSAPASAEGGHPLPTPEDFASCMQLLGVNNDSHVICYDDAGGVIAGRLWWLLNSVNCQASVLAGGINSWFGPMAKGIASDLKRGNFSPKPFPRTHFITADEIESRVPEVTVVDARISERYHGATGGDYPRYGHVPGAVNVPAYDNFSDLETRIFHSKEKLAALYESIGVTNLDQPVVTYCGSGVSACTDLLALRLLGFKNLRLYTGSFSEWGADYSRPIEK